MAWYKDWFNSPYYHILYGQHNNAEAGFFIKNLAEKLNFCEHQIVLDVACGKGRHSKELAKHNLIVYGIDLSVESIKEAQLSSSDNLSFEVHDMRKVYKKMFFDYVFNIFTSFGYFADSGDNLSTLKAVKENLKPGGIFIQDYFNSDLIKQSFTAHFEKTVGNIEFRIEKKISNNKIYKSIHFTDDGQPYDFCEVVDLFTLNDFEKMYMEAGLKITQIYGDYELNSFDSQTSKRLILISTPV